MPVVVRPLILQRQIVIRVSSAVVALAGAVLAGSSPSGPVQGVVGVGAVGVGDSVEESADFVHCQRDQIFGSVRRSPFCAVWRVMARNAVAAMARVMWRYQAV